MQPNLIPLAGGFVAAGQPVNTKHQGSVGCIVIQGGLVGQVTVLLDNQGYPSNRLVIQVTAGLGSGGLAGMATFRLGTPVPGSGFTIEAIRSDTLVAMDCPYSFGVFLLPKDL